MNNSHNFSFLIDPDSEKVQQHFAFEKKDSKFVKQIKNSIGNNQEPLLRPLFSRDIIKL